MKGKKGEKDVTRMREMKKGAEGGEREGNGGLRCRGAEIGKERKL